VGRNRAPSEQTVEVYVGALYQNGNPHAASGYLGQDSTDLIVDSAANAKRISCAFSGPPRSAGRSSPLRRRNAQITELDRRGSSCPSSSPWNGSSYDFIADMSAPESLPLVAPGERNIADPTEYMKVDGAHVSSAQRPLSFVSPNPWKKLCTSIKRASCRRSPAGVTVFRMNASSANPPFPEFKVIAAAERILPLARRDDLGRMYLRMLAPTAITLLDLTCAIQRLCKCTVWNWIWRMDSSRPLRLLMHGFTDYFTRDLMYAADQAGMKVIVPYVEALDASALVRVITNGFPAGLARSWLPTSPEKFRAHKTMPHYNKLMILLGSDPDR